MKQHLVRCVVVALLVLMAPRPASAELGFFRWWDSLSGPGPFSGVIVDPVFLCHGKMNETGDEGVPLLDLGCIHAHRARMRINIGVKFGRLDGKNNLPYANGPAPEVHAYPVMGTASVSWHPAVEIGAALGFVRFSGDGFGFNRFAVEPRLTVRPLVIGSKVNSRRQRQLEFLQLRLSGTGMPGDFSAADFGAIGSFHTDAEWLPGFAVVVDFSSLIWPTGRR